MTGKVATPQKKIKTEKNTSRPKAPNGPQQRREKEKKNKTEKLFY